MESANPSNLLPTPIRVDKLRPLLYRYHDHDYVLNGLVHGFNLDYEGDYFSQRCNNNLSVNTNPEVALSKVMGEVRKGRIAGPFDSPPLPFFRCSPLSLREKSTPGQFRLLHNLSYPHNNSSVNSNIPRRCTKTEYATFDDAVDIINSYDSPFLAKTDIAEAFRLIPLHPSNYSLTGFKLDGHYYYDRCLPMGASSSCLIFERFSDAIVFILKTRYLVKHIVKVLDDFLFIAETYESCLGALIAFKHLSGIINLPIAHHKTEGPTHVLTFLGIQLDTELGIVSIPRNKIIPYTEAITTAIAGKKLTLRDLRSLTGKLAFVSQIIPVGRCFLRRLYDLTIGISRPSSSIKLPEGAILDLKVWLDFLANYNARELYASKLPAPLSRRFTTDATPRGYGAHFQGSYFYGCFPDAWNHLDIQAKEFYPIFVLVSLLAPELQNTTITMVTDNMSVMHAINSQTSRNKYIMSLLRRFVLVLLKNNIACTAEYIESRNNLISDALSRLQLPTALQAIRDSGFHPSVISIPSSLRPNNLTI